jgi:hypothetical protein
MKPVDQTLTGEAGNCFSACLASLLELPVEQVPNFGVDGLPPFGVTEAEHLLWSRRFFENVNAWLAPLGFSYFEVATPEALPEILWAAVPSGFWIAVGPGGRETTNHAVVMQGREIVHDPHPSRAGLLEARGIGVLVPLDPVQERRDREDLVLEEQDRDE